MDKFRNLYIKHHEVASYLIFGALTTAVDFIVYFVALRAGEAILGLPAGDPTDFLRTVGQTVAWLFSMLFAFFVNKKWVFTDKTAGRGAIRQLLTFAGSRVITLVLNIYLIIWTVRLLEFLNFSKFWIIDADFIAKIVSAVVIVITNYIISKLFVFRKRGNE